MTSILSHLAIARLEHAIVRTERELYVAHETGKEISIEDLQLRLDMMNRVYLFYHHSPQTKPTLNHEQASYSTVHLTSHVGRDKTVDEYILNEIDGRERA